MEKPMHVSMEKNTHGGSGRGQGRKKIAPIGAQKRQILMTNNEHMAVRKLLETMRKE